MRGEPGPGELVRRFADLVDAALGVGAGALGLGGVGVVDQRRCGNGPHAGVLDRARGRVSVPVHVPEAGRPSADHLDAGEPRAPVDVVIVHPLLDRPDVPGQPLHQRQVVGEAAKQGHRRVRVAVDQARERAPSPPASTTSSPGLRFDPRPERDDLAALAAQPDRDSVERRVGHRQAHSLKRMRVFAGARGRRPRRPRRGARAPAIADRRGAARGGRAPPRGAADARRARTSPISSTRTASSSTAGSRSRRSGCAASVDELIARTPGRRPDRRHRPDQRRAVRRRAPPARCSPTTTRCSPGPRARSAIARRTACSS